MSIDSQTQKNINEVNVYVRDTLMSISTKFSEAMADAVENAFDNLDQKVISSVEKDLTKTFKSLVKSSDDISLNIYKLKEGLIGSKDLAKQQANIDQQRILLAAKINHAKLMGVTFSAEDLANAEKALNVNQKELDIAKELNDQVEKRLGLTGKLVGSLNKIPGIGKFIKADELEKELRMAAFNGANQFQILGLTIGKSFKQIGKGLLDPLTLLTAQIALIKSVFNLFNSYDELLVNQAKQLGISRDESEKLYQSATVYLSTQKSSFLNEERILKARMALNESMGTSIAISNEEAGVAARLSELYGLSGDENAKIFQLSAATNQTNKQILDTVMKTAVTQKAQSGGTLQYQQILKRVSGTSGDILTKFKGNVTALTEAIMQADKLGLTLEQVEKVSQSLLNFESSIENELKAELLTGKAINLERARSAALSGDTKKLMAEIRTQVGDIHKFERMNTIQRQAYAEAFGMSASEMGDMLRKQELEAKFAAAGAKSAQEKLDYAKKNNMELSDAVEKDLEQRSLADLQKDVFINLQKVLTQIVAGPGKEFGKMLKSALENVMGIVNFFREMTGGKLGSGLGAVLLGAPLLLGGMRLILGTAKSIFANGLTPMTAPWVKVANMGGMMGGPGGPMMGGPMGGLMGKSQFAGGSFSAGRQLVAQRQMMGLGGGFKGFMGSSMGMGLAGMGVGLGTSALTSNMEAGGARTAVSSVGSAASMGLMGASIGSMIAPGIGTAIGAGLGALIGGISSLVSEMEATREKEKEKTEALKEYNKSTQEMMNQLMIRPTELNVGTKTVAEFRTSMRQYGSSGVFA
jgi:hypothetical protein